MIKYIFGMLMLLGITFTISSCEKDNTDAAVNLLDGYTKLNEGYAIGAATKVEIWAQKNYFVGYNSLLVVAYDSLNSSEKITDAQISFMPLMTMTSGVAVMKHACPVENPDEKQEDGIFKGAVDFVMASAEGDTWQLSLLVHNNKNDKVGTATFDIAVDNPEVSELTVFTSTDASAAKLVLTLVQPSEPKVGMNDIEFTIHQKKSMMEWPADDSYSIQITPEMPSMGHGSPNNVNPENSGKGHYKGKVNFTMTGEWRVTVVVLKDNVPVSPNLYFTIIL
jgi:hypothetical protein